MAVKFYSILIIVILSSCQKDLSMKRETFADETSLLLKDKRPEPDLIRTKNKAEEALKFCKDNNMNTEFCILIDMSLHSGVKRFFIWNLKEKRIVDEYLVGHGCGLNSWSRDDSKETPAFSNEDGSHLSSLGKYKLSERGHSDWGINIKYLMIGLEESNSNALKRYIVFHSWNLMSDEDVYPKGSPEGWGCPTVSNNAMRKIDPMLQNSKKPVLIWIYK